MSVGLNPGHGTGVLEQDALLQLLLFTQGYTARVEVDIVYKKATSAIQQLRAVYSTGSPMTRTLITIIYTQRTGKEITTQYQTMKLL